MYLPPGLGLKKADWSLIPLQGYVQVCFAVCCLKCRKHTRVLDGVGMLHIDNLEVHLKR